MPDKKIGAQGAGGARGARASKVGWDVRCILPFPAVKETDIYVHDERRT